MKRESIPFYEAFEYIRKSAITDVVVASAPQNLYYLPPNTCYRVDDSLKLRLRSLHDVYVLDFDRSQTLERSPATMTGDYALMLHDLPARVRIVFQGPDARVIRF
jgi:hypothetical protein